MKIPRNFLIPTDTHRIGQYTCRIWNMNNTAGGMAFLKTPRKMYLSFWGIDPHWQMSAAAFAYTSDV
jgi:hypothetical protein